MGKLVPVQLAEPGQPDLASSQGNYVTSLTRISNISHLSLTALIMFLYSGQCPLVPCLLIYLQPQILVNPRHRHVAGLTFHFRSPRSVTLKLIRSSI